MTRSLKESVLGQGPNQGGKILQGNRKKVNAIHFGKRPILGEGAFAKGKKGLHRNPGKRTGLTTLQIKKKKKKAKKMRAARREKPPVLLEESLSRKRGGVSAAGGKKGGGESCLVTWGGRSRLHWDYSPIGGKRLLGEERRFDETFR